MTCGPMWVVTLVHLPCHYHQMNRLTVKINLKCKMIITSGKLKAVSSPPFWEGCWETGGPAAADGMEEELGGLTTGCPCPLPLGCGCPAWFRRCNSCVSLSLWWSVAVLAAIGLLGVGSTVTKMISIHNCNIHLR